MTEETILRVEKLQKEMHSFIATFSEIALQEGKNLQYEAFVTTFFLIKISELEARLNNLLIPNPN